MDITITSIAPNHVEIKNEATNECIEATVEDLGIEDTSEGAPELTLELYEAARDYAKQQWADKPA